MLDIKHTGGNVKEAFPCYESKTTTPHTNSDAIDDEDDDVKAERKRVKAVFDRNNIKVSGSSCLFCKTDGRVVNSAGLTLLKITLWFSCGLWGRKV
jgi:hypothetical protein